MINQAGEQNIDTFEHRVVRRILSREKVHGGWRSEVDRRVHWTMVSAFKRRGLSTEKTKLQEAKDQHRNLAPFRQKK